MSLFDDLAKAIEVVKSTKATVDDLTAKLIKASDDHTDAVTKATDARNALLADVANYLPSVNDAQKAVGVKAK